MAAEVGGVGAVAAGAVAADVADRLIHDIGLPAITQTRPRSSVDHRNKPNIKQAWKRFGEVTLPRRRLVKDDETGKLVWRRAELGDGESTLFPVWGTSVHQLDQFGLGIGLYFWQLIGLALVSLVAFFVYIPTFVYFSEVEYGGDGELLSGGNVLTAVKTFGSAVCDGTSMMSVNATCAGGGGYCNETLFTDACVLSWENNAVGDIIVCGIFTLFCLFLRKIQGGLVEQMDESNQTTQDYSLVVEDPDANADDPSEWYDFFSKFGQVCYVTVARGNGRLLRALAKRRHILRMCRLLHIADATMVTPKASRRSDGRRELRPPTFAQQYLGLGRDEQFWEWRLQQQEALVMQLARRWYPVTKVFVTFDDEAAQRKALRHLSIGLIPAALDIKGMVAHGDMFRGSNVLSVAESVEPSELIWENLGVTNTRRYLQKTVSLVATAAIVAGAYFAIESVHGHGGAYAALAISGINVVLPNVCKAITFKLERHIDEGDRQKSLLVKLVMARFMNTAGLMYLITPFTETLTQENIDSIQAILFADMLLSPGITVAQICADWLKRSVIAPWASHNQEKMDAFFDGAVWNIAERYTAMTKTLFVALFYSALVPSGLLLTSLAMFFTYWSDKYRLLRIWRQVPELDASLAETSRGHITFAILCHFIVTTQFFASWPFDAAYAPPPGSAAANATATGYIGADKNPSPFFYDVAEDVFAGTLASEKGAWMPSEQRKITQVYTVAAVAMAAIIFGASFLGSVWHGLRRLWFGIYKPVGKAMEKRYSSIVPPEKIEAYIPVVSKTSYGLHEHLLAASLSQVRPDHFPQFLNKMKSRKGVSVKDISFRKKTHSRRQVVTAARQLADSGGDLGGDVDVDIEKLAENNLLLDMEAIMAPELRAKPAETRAKIAKLFSCVRWFKSDLKRWDLRPKHNADETRMRNFASFHSEQLGAVVRRNSILAADAMATAAAKDGRGRSKGAGRFAKKRHAENKLALAPLYPHNGRGGTGDPLLDRVMEGIQSGLLAAIVRFQKSSPNSPSIGTDSLQRVFERLARRRGDEQMSSSDEEGGDSDGGGGEDDKPRGGGHPPGAVDTDKQQPEEKAASAKAPPAADVVERADQADTASLLAEFQAAVGHLRTKTETEPVPKSSADKLQVYALYKRATLGACTGEEPAAWNVKECAKWKAWKNLDDTDKHDARQQYIALCRQHCPDFEFRLSADVADDGCEKGTGSEPTDKGAAADVDYSTTSESGSGTDSEADSETDSESGSESESESESEAETKSDAGSSDDDNDDEDEGESHGPSEDELRKFQETLIGGGLTMTLHSATGRPKQIRLQLSDRDVLKCTSTSGFVGVRKRQIDLSNKDFLLQVGKKTANFERTTAVAVDAGLCFSVGASENVVLDLECASKEERELAIAFLERLKIEKGGREEEVCDGAADSADTGPGDAEQPADADAAKPDKRQRKVSFEQAIAETKMKFEAAAAFVRRNGKKAVAASKRDKHAAKSEESENSALEQHHVVVTSDDLLDLYGLSKVATSGAPKSGAMKFGMPQFSKKKQAAWTAAYSVVRSRVDASCDDDDDGGGDEAGPLPSIEEHNKLNRNESFALAVGKPFKRLASGNKHSGGAGGSLSSPESLSADAKLRRVAMEMYLNRVGEIFPKFSEVGDGAGGGDNDESANDADREEPGGEKTQSGAAGDASRKIASNRDLFEMATRHMAELGAIEQAKVEKKEKDDRKRERAPSWRRPPALDQKTQLQLFGLYKAATVGTCTKKRPGNRRPMDQARWEEWKSNKHMSKAQAATRYIEIALTKSPELAAEVDDYVKTHPDEPVQVKHVDLFLAASEHVRTEPVLIDGTTRLRLYALSQVATVGFCTGKRPGAVDPTGRAQWDAWNALDISSQEAERKYVDLVRRLSPEFLKAHPISASDFAKPIELDLLRPDETIEHGSNDVDDEAATKRREAQQARLRRTVEMMFPVAVNHVRAQGSKISMDDFTRAQLHALFQASSKGALMSELTKRPARGLKEQAQWDAWNQLGNITQVEAREEYLALTRQISPAFAAQYPALTPLAALADTRARARSFSGDLGHKTDEDLFLLAQDHVQNNAKGVFLPDSSTMLRLFGLEMTATEGRCTEPRPVDLRSAENADNDGGDRAGAGVSEAGEGPANLLMAAMSLTTPMGRPPKGPHSYPSLLTHGETGPVMDLLGSRWDAWKRVDAMRLDDAMREYTAVARRAFPEFHKVHPPSGESGGEGDVSPPATTTHAPEYTLAQMFELAVDFVEAARLEDDRLEETETDTLSAAARTRLAALSMVGLGDGFSLSDPAPKRMDAERALWDSWKHAVEMFTPEQAMFQFIMETRSLLPNFMNRYALPPEPAAPLELLEDRFVRARLHMSSDDAPETVPQDEQIKLYGLYKQATAGNALSTRRRRPSMMDPMGRAKFDAWRKFDDLAPQEAKSEYVGLVALLSPAFSFVPPTTPKTATAVTGSMPPHSPAPGATQAPPLSPLRSDSGEVTSTPRLPVIEDDRPLSEADAQLMQLMRSLPLSERRLISKVQVILAEMTGGRHFDAAHVFQQLDSDGDGRIDLGDLQQGLLMVGLRAVDSEDMEPIIRLFDGNRDGFLECDEFCRYCSLPNIKDWVSTKPLDPGATPAAAAKRQKTARDGDATAAPSLKEDPLEDLFLLAADHVRTELVRFQGHKSSNKPYGPHIDESTALQLHGLFRRATMHGYVPDMPSVGTATPMATKRWIAWRDARNRYTVAEAMQEYVDLVRSVSTTFNPQYQSASAPPGFKHAQKNAASSVGAVDESRDVLSGDILAMFEEAAEHVQRNVARARAQGDWEALPRRRDMLRLCALHKRTTTGRCPPGQSRPSSSTPDLRAKWDAWKALETGGGISTRAQAAQAYVDTVKGCFPGWTPASAAVELLSASDNSGGSTTDDDGWFSENSASSDSDYTASDSSDTDASDPDKDVGTGTSLKKNDVVARSGALKHTCSETRSAHLLPGHITKRDFLRGLVTLGCNFDADGGEAGKPSRAAVGADELLKGQTRGRFALRSQKLSEEREARRADNDPLLPDAAVSDVSDVLGGSSSSAAFAFDSSLSAESSDLSLSSEQPSEEANEESADDWATASSEEDEEVAAAAYSDDGGGREERARARRRRAAAKTRERRERLRRRRRLLRAARVRRHYRLRNMRDMLRFVVRLTQEKAEMIAAGDDRAEAERLYPLEMDEKKPVEWKDAKRVARANERRESARREQLAKRRKFMRDRKEEREDSGRRNVGIDFAAFLEFALGGCFSGGDLEHWGSRMKMRLDRQGRNRRAGGAGDAAFAKEASSELLPVPAPRSPVRRSLNRGMRSLRRSWRVGGSRVSFVSDDADDNEGGFSIAMKTRNSSPSSSPSKSPLRRRGRGSRDANHSGSDTSGLSDSDGTADWRRRRRRRRLKQHQTPAAPPRSWDPLRVVGDVNALPQMPPFYAPPPLPPPPPTSLRGDWDRPIMPRGSPAAGSQRVKVSVHEARSNLDMFRQQQDDFLESRAI